MSANNVPNKIEKENFLGNMIIESGLISIKEEKLVNHENIINNEIPNLEIEKHKKTDFPHTKFKKNKNHIKQKGETINVQKFKNKSSLYLRRDSKGTKNRSNKINVDSRKI